MSIVISNAFKVIEGRPVTSSRIVAEYFGKQHKDTLRAIRDLIADAPELERKRNFALTEEEQKIGRVDDGHTDGDFDRCFGRVYVHGLVRHAVP